MIKILKLSSLKCNINKINRKATYERKYGQFIHLPKELFWGGYKKNSQFNNKKTNHPIKRGKGTEPALHRGSDGDYQ